LYQQWKANTFTVNLDLNGMTLRSPIFDDIPSVDEALSAEGGLAKAKQTLPTITEEVTIEEEGGIYEFVNWADKKDGSGNIISASTPLFPKDGEADVTLYAQWRIKDIVQLAYTYNGNSSTGTDGSVQTWKVPIAGVYKIEVWGAGRKAANTNNGGFGGYIGGNIELKAGQELYIYVGGMTNAGTRGGYGINDVQQAGGWNGGGASGGTPNGVGNNTGGGGHGATDVRTVKGSSDTDWSNQTSLESRIIVAGGGGGGGTGGGSGNGGIGIAEGGDCIKTDTESTATAGGGRLTTGGVSYPRIDRGDEGKLGMGGHGGRQICGGGGGGGGYYGGGGGTDIPGGRNPCSGGGGSSWAQTYPGAALKFTDVTPSINGGGTNGGHGKVMITLVSTASE
jgi:hypothetical protein